MMNEGKKPREYDLVLGGNNPLPVDGAVLGGIEGVKRRLASSEVEVRIAAVQDALNYQDEGLDLVIKALQDESRKVQKSAYKLLRNKEENKVKNALASYQPWNLRERLQEYPGYKARHSEVFANRRVENFDIKIGIVDPVNIAYAFRCDRWIEGETPSLRNQLNRLLGDFQVDKVEALVFGMYSDVFERGQSEYIIRFLVSNKDRMKNLKAIFIGDIHYEECEISWIGQSDIAPMLEAYPNLEILQIRAGENREFFSPIRHDKLQALIVESGVLNAENIINIGASKLPSLEHLELWIGSPNYLGSSSLDDILPIINSESFPNLIYLGLRNIEKYADELTTVLVKSSILSRISVLDLSMGTLTDKGAEILLNCPAINKLKLLNISENYLSDTMVNKFQQLNIEVIADRQNPDNDYYDDNTNEDYRYCSVRE